jgi:hypothetical protein
MTVNSALTTQIAASAAPAKSGVAMGKAAGAPAAGGLAFFDLFLANAEKAIDLQLGALQTAKAGTGTPVPTNPLLQPTALSLANAPANVQANLNITEALANSAYTTNELSKIQNPQLSDVLALNQQVDDETLLTIQVPGSQGQASALQNAIISGEADFRPALNNLQRILQKLQSLAQKDSPNLIGTNVTPDQITALQKKVEDLLNGITQDGKTEAEEFAGIFAGLIQILPPQPQPQAVVVEGAPQPPAAQTPSTPEIPAGTKPGEDLAAKLNNLIMSGSEDGDADGQNPSGQQKHQQAQVQGPQQPAQNHTQNQSAAGEKWTLPESFKSLTDDNGEFSLKTESSVKTGDLSPKDLALAAAGHGKAQTAGAAPDLSVLKANLPFFAGEASATPALYTTAAPTGAEGFGLQLTSLTAMTQGAAGSVLTQAPQAGLPHPGTQMVAATMQKAGGTGQDSRITLQLDPPELGRVEIKMSFEKNSKIKAVLTVEKAETHAMLQKDSGILERILQDAGLDTEGGLSFELAKEGYAFGRDGNQGGGQSNQGRGADADTGDEILQATMNWAVDPETGHTHYNIMA